MTYVDVLAPVPSAKAKMITAVTRALSQKPVGVDEIAQHMRRLANPVPLASRPNSTKHNPRIYSNRLDCSLLGLHSVRLRGGKGGVSRDETPCFTRAARAETRISGR